MVKNAPAKAGDTRGTDSVPGLGRSPAVGNGNPLQYSCLENFMNRRAWQATVSWGHKELDMTERVCNTPPHTPVNNLEFLWF